MTKREPIVFIVSGPSGSGKSTLVHKILELPDTVLSVSCTTRKPRAAENPGKWYNFVSEEEFRKMVEAGAFLEYAQVFGKNWYGTPRRNWLEAKEKGADLILEIDVQGAKQVQQGPLSESVVSIFILPPSPVELERRIRARGMDSEDEIQRRLRQARTEILAFSECYDYQVVNDDVERAGEEIRAIVLEERRRAPVDRRKERSGTGAVTATVPRRADRQSKVQRILESFGDRG
ncbi:MAG TPA: guanylate kinase [Candidatus Acidoferrales bacterium]|nr:guanylate kinase [Candidatus Acidoferrales bacterium]